MQSLQHRIRAGMLVALALAGAALLYWGHTGIGRLAESYVLTRLKHDADNLLAALSRDPGGSWRLDPDRVGGIYDRVYSGHYYQVATPDGILRSRSMWDFDAAAPATGTGETATFEIPGPAGERWLVWSQGVEKTGTPVAVWVAEDLSAIRAEQRHYTLWTAAVFALVLLVLLLAQHRILASGFAKLEPLRAAVRDLRSGTRTALDGDVPSEIAPLADEINRLLVRLKGKVSRSRNAMGNLAHEMKRPIHRLRRLAVSLPAGQHDELKGQIDDLERLVARELKRARIVGVATPGRHTRLDEDLTPLVDAVQRMYPESRIRTVVPPDTVLPHDRDDVLELAGNLLDNACKHGGGDVLFDITESTDGWTLRVVDGGPGIPAGGWQRAMTRGGRLDESRAGHGLGLAICTDIVDEYGGRIELSEDAEPGFEVRVFLPREAADS